MDAGEPVDVFSRDLGSYRPKGSGLSDRWRVHVAIVRWRGSSGKECRMNDQSPEAVSNALFAELLALDWTQPDGRLDAVTRHLSGLTPQQSIDAPLVVALYLLDLCQALMETITQSRCSAPLALSAIRAAMPLSAPTSQPRALCHRSGTRMPPSHPGSPSSTHGTSDRYTRQSPRSTTAT